MKTTSFFLTLLLILSFASSVFATDTCHRGDGRREPIDCKK